MSVRDMSENPKPPTTIKIPLKLNKTCVQLCAVALSYHIQIFILRDLIKLAFTLQNMCGAAQQLKSRTHNSHFWGSEASRASGDFCAAQSRDLFRNSPLFPHKWLRLVSQSLISAKLGIISHSQIKTNGENRH